MLIGSVLLTILLSLFFILYLLIVKIMNRFVDFPISTPVASFTDNPIGRKLRLSKKVVDWIDIRNGMFTLEIGYSGYFSIEAEKYVGETGRVFTIYSRQETVSRLNDRLQKQGVNNVVPVVASIYNLPFLDKTFDRAFIGAVLKEIPDKKTALLEIQRVIKDYGLLAIGKFSPEKDHPPQKTILEWSKNSGFELITSMGGDPYYVLVFKRLIFQSSPL